MNLRDIKNNKLDEKITPQEVKNIHFIGIGGIGMSALAFFLKDLGFSVSGSDIKEGVMTQKLEDAGIKVFIGQKKENIDNVSHVAVSSAIKEDNEEILEAFQRNLPIYHRSQVLSALMKGLGRSEKIISIGVAGTHGKTTTSGMMATVLEKIGVDPSIVVGGRIKALENVNAKLGKGKFFVSELDESDGTIEFYSPTYTIITNLEEDHLDYYEDGLSQLLKTFEKFSSNLKKNSALVVNIDCNGNKEFLKNVKGKVITYSLKDKEADYFACNIRQEGVKTKAEVCKKGKLLGEIVLNVPGYHNVSNALSVIAVAIESGLSFEEVKEGLSSFVGMGRRFDRVGEEKGILVIDDYAHHPAEIIATLKAAREAFGNRRIVSIFQPHRYSRLEGLWHEFLGCFDVADKVYILDVYSAGENEIDGINSQKLCAAVRNAVYVSGNIEAAAQTIAPALIESDIVLTMGAGDITKLGKYLLEELKNCAAV